MRNLPESYLRKRDGAFRTLRILVKKELLSFTRNRLYLGLYLLFCAASCIFREPERNLLFIVAGTMLFADLAYTSMKNDLKADALSFIHNLCGSYRSFIVLKICLYTVLAIVPYALMTVLEADAAIFHAYPFLPLYFAGLAAFSITGAFLTRKSDSVIWAAVVVANLALFYALQRVSLPFQLVFSVLWLMIFSITAILFSRKH